MGGGGHGAGDGVTYKGVTIHQPKRWHTLTGRGLCAIMWFWVFYRAKKDAPVVLGWRHPWEGHDDHSEHEHANEHKDVLEMIKITKRVVDVPFLILSGFPLRIKLGMLKDDPGVTSYASDVDE